MRPLLFRLDAERAHNLALRAAELSGRSSLVRRAAGRAFTYRDPRLETSLAGLPLANPLGLAAGFDKNARAVGMLGALGFGHLEIGSVSARRLRRQPEAAAVPDPAGRGDRRRLRRAQRRRGRGARAADRARGASRSA